MRRLILKLRLTFAEIAFENALDAYEIAYRSVYRGKSAVRVQSLMLKLERAHNHMYDLQRRLDNLK